MNARFPIILRVALELTAKMPLRSTLIAIGSHFALSWMGYAVLGEELAKSPVNMIYNYVVTGSSVGYGDLAPQTAAGRLFAAFWVIPGSLAGFAWIIGRIIQHLSSSARKKMTGTAEYSHVRDHVLIIGYVKGETDALITETQPGKSSTILMSQDNIEGRVPGDLPWVYAPDLADVDALKRAGVDGAQKVMVMIGDDDATLATCLALCGNWPGKRVVALFRDGRKASLLNGNCPSVEAVVSPAASLLARASDGPGTASVIHRLLSVKIDDTLEHASWTGNDVTVAEIAKVMSNHQCLLVAIGSGKGEPDLVPDPNTVVHNGENVYYIGKASYSAFNASGGIV